MVIVRTTAIAAFALTTTLVVAACGGEASEPPAPDITPSTDPSPSAVASAMAPDLSAIGCATQDPDGVGELTGAWRGDDTGTYYIRHVGDCIWWFGTEVVDIEPGMTAQAGFANVAAGRVNGSQIVVEWADVPLGNILGGGGLTLVYDEGQDQLLITERRGDWQPFGATILTRIEQDASRSPTGPASSSP